MNISSEVTPVTSVLTLTGLPKILTSKYRHIIWLFLAPPLTPITDVVIFVSYVVEILMSDPIPMYVSCKYIHSLFFYQRFGRFILPRNSILVSGDSNSVCWIWKFPIHFPRNWVRVPCCDMIDLITSLNSYLSPPPSIVVSYRYYFLIRNTSPVVMKASQYTLAHIWYWLMHTSSVWVNFTVLIIKSTTN